MFAPELVVAVLALVATAGGVVLWRRRKAPELVALPEPPPTSPPTPAPPVSDDSKTVLDDIRAAVDEQARREGTHHVPYRHDQRVAAVQQRLSRKLGPRAFDKTLHGEIVRELRKRGLARH